MGGFPEMEIRASPRPCLSLSAPQSAASTPKKKRQPPLVVQCGKRHELQLLVDEDASMAPRLNQCHHRRLICIPLPYSRLFFNFLISNNSLTAPLDFKKLNPA